MAISMIASLLAACVVTPIGYRYDDGYCIHHYRDYGYYGYYHDHAKS